MFKDHITTALSTARGRVLDDVSRVIWKGLAEGLLSDDEAQAFAEQLHVRRMAEGAARASQTAPGGQGRPRSIFPPRKPQRPPLRPVAIERRRRLASSGPLPPSIASRFTTGELAVLRIVADEVRDRGECTKTIDAIAARAGVGRTTTQNTLRLAVRLGLVKVEERRQTGAKSLPNRVTVVSPEWKAWSARGPRGEGIGFKSLNTTDTNILQKKKKSAGSASRHDQRRGMRRPHEVGR